METDIINLQIFLTNSLTNKKELFTPIDENNILMYVCGITPYDYAHLGHGRCYVTFDVLYRLLNLFDYQVTYCRNFTDIDDKLINRAIKERSNAHEYTKIADEFIEKYHSDMNKLNCLAPTYEPYVTKNIPEIIEFVSGLIKNNRAYNIDGNVYYSIDNCPDYGKLSKRSLEDLRAGARIEVREEKRNPLDFALWKKANKADNEVGWDSPWGFGRPGWHIECSALIRKYLGQTIDIHGGGMDLIFPHHENEIAQSEGLSNGEPLANYWVHNAFVEINKEKMSKSLNNFVKLHDLFEHHDPMIVRYYYLQHHYRNPLDFSIPDLEAAAKAYQKICIFFDKLDPKLKDFSDTEGGPCDYPIAMSMINAICDDLNCSKFFGILFDNLKNIESDLAQASLIKNLLIQLMGLDLKTIKTKEIIVTAEIQELISKREIARSEKNWTLADKIRDELKALGYNIQDNKI